MGFEAVEAVAAGRASCLEWKDHSTAAVVVGAAKTSHWQIGAAVAVAVAAVAVAADAAVTDLIAKKCTGSGG